MHTRSEADEPLHPLGGANAPEQSHLHAIACMLSLRLPLRFGFQGLSLGLRLSPVGPVSPCARPGLSLERLSTTP